MARVINTDANIKIGFSIVNHYTDGETQLTNLYKDDIVENFSYVEDHEVKTVNGRISNISFSPVTKTSKSISDVIKNQVVINSVTIDTSRMYNSESVTVPAREILEYNSDGIETERVEIAPIISVELSTTLSDGTQTFGILNEGDLISDVVLLTKDGDKTVDLNIDHFVYTIDQKKMTISVSGIVTKDDKKNVLDIYAIKCCGKEAIIVSDNALIQDVLDNLENPKLNNAILLPTNIYDEDISLTGNITIRGNYSETVANTGFRCSNNIDDDETVLIGDITCEKDSEVTLQGIVITEDASIKIEGAKSLTFKNCKFVSMNPLKDVTKAMVLTTTGSDPIEFKVEGCYFGDNKTVDGKTFYNGFELKSPLKKGSYIKNNYFTKKFISHNIINIYNIEDGARITISGNIFEYSANAIRIGTLGDVKGVINIKNNTYEETDANKDYAGLVIIQPYAKKTISMANLTVNIDNTTKPDGQLYYGYFGNNDTQMNSSLWCKVYVNGRKEIITVGDDKVDKTTTSTTEVAR